MNTCDRHPTARAMWLVYFDNGPLFFCNHCWNKYKDQVVLKYRYTDLADTVKRRIPIAFHR